MENKQLDTILNEKTGNKFGFKLKGAKLDKATSLCQVELFYQDGVILSKEDREMAEQIVKQCLPVGFEYQVKFIKNFVVNESVNSKIEEFFKKNHPSVIYKINKIDCENQEKQVEILVDERLFDYVGKSNVKKDLEEFLHQNFYAQINIDIGAGKISDNLVVDDSEDLVFENFVQEDQRTIEVSNVEPVVGDFSDNVAFYIKDKNTPDQEVVFCGKLNYIREYSFIPKKKKEDKEEQNKEQDEKPVGEQNKEDAGTPEGQDEPVKNERKYFKFSLEDFTGKIQCVFFANKNNYEKMLTIQQNDTLIINGKLEADKFSGGVSLRVKNISKCTLPEVFEEKIVFKEEPKNYRYVFPEQVEFYSQANLFAVEEAPTDQFLLENKFVVFDFETTGLNVTDGDKIIEIGAVKIEGGKITERFMSFVDPEMHIPEASTKIHGIVDKDVKGSPTYDMALPDFYKFTRGCYLVGYNSISFDYGFLNYYGRLCGYNFDNPQLDVYKMAVKGVTGVKNHKLGTVAEKMGVVLDNAHRAVYDAIATAELLIKLIAFR